MKRLRALLMCMLSVSFVGTTTLACDGSGGSASDNGSTTDDGCAISLCGCSTDATMTFSATVQDASTTTPLMGIELVCFGETTPIAVSDAAGKLSFSIQTRLSPGCGFDRCNNMKLHDPSSVKMDLEGTYYAFNEKTLPM